MKTSIAPVPLPLTTFPAHPCVTKQNGPRSTGISKHLLVYPSAGRPYELELPMGERFSSRAGAPLFREVLRTRSKILAVSPSPRGERASCIRIPPRPVPQLAQRAIE